MKTMDKKQMFEALERKKQQYFDAADRIWEHPETSFEEYFAADLLCGLLEKEGFASMITVINGGAKGETEAARVRFLNTESHSLKRPLTEREAQAVQICVGDRSYVVTICHDEIYHTSDAVIARDGNADGSGKDRINCYSTGSVCVFDITGREDGARIYGGEVLQA